MRTLQELAAIEEIKQLKACYFRCVDTMDLEGFLDVFMEDAALLYDYEVAVTGTPRQLKLNGRKEMAEFCNRSWRTEMLWSAHHGMTAEIEILSTSEARAIWAMQDVLEMSDSHYHGYGHYRETYRQREGKWRIQTLHLTRTRVVVTPREKR